MSIALEQLHPVFAGRVTGVDLREPQDAATIDAIDDAISQFGILVLPNQFITDSQQ